MEQNTTGTLKRHRLWGNADKNKGQGINKSSNPELVPSTLTKIDRHTQYEGTLIKRTYPWSSVFGG
jgi:hypothetical protein